jgi:YidC/Oxa1 family membrane protein insertase
MKLWVTILSILIGCAFIVGVMTKSRNTNAPGSIPPAVVSDGSAELAAEPANDETLAIEDAPEAADQASGTIADQAEPLTQAAAEVQPSVETAEADPVPVTTDSPQITAAPVETVPGLHAVEVKDGRDTVIGYDDPRSPFKLRVELTQWGAGIQSISLNDYLKVVDEPNDHYIVHDELTLPGKEQPEWYAYAVKAVTVNGTRVSLESAPPVWSAGDVTTNDQTSSVTYTATIADGDGQPVLKIVRRYTAKADSYDLTLDQQLINLSDEPLNVRWEQNLQGDVVNDSGYLGDRRKFVSGYFATWWDPNKAGIYTRDAEMTRSKVVGAKGADVWPPYGLNPEADLVWIASINRYFAVITHAALDDSVQVTADVPSLQSVFPHIDQFVAFDKTNPTPTDVDKLVIIKAGTDTITLPAGGETDLDLGIFAGPRQPELFDTPPYSTLHLDQTIVYSLGGMCSFCTFQWLAHGLIWLLKLFEGQILVLGGVGIGFHDWGVAIILLVLVVRLMLHPLTKRAQINMMKMGKMMQAIQPEVEKLKKKYKDDQPKINTEMMKLYKEKGVNPANVLGCLPMFLQTPIWIALYAMLYYAIELRHEAAFWGFFQWVSGGAWGFLQDLSSQDGFIQIFAEPRNINLLITDVDFQSINILPLLMGVVFYFQQKLTTPPAANDQQAQQQKMMKFMIFLFPVFLYFAPSGLTLYIMASTSAGIVDSYIVRKHIKEQEESGELFKPKPVKTGGLRDRIAKAVEAKQQQLSQQNKGGKPRKRK